jgi:arylsulfatase A-like enzyme
LNNPADDAGVKNFPPYADDGCHRCGAARRYTTPRLDELASTGMRFRHAHSLPICTPSRNKIMTGRSNIRNYEKFGTLLRDEITFGHVMKAAGYATALAGKWQLGSADDDPSLCEVEFVSNARSVTQTNANTKQPPLTPADFGFDTYSVGTSDSRYWR